MIIKSTRIPTLGTKNVARYLSTRGENEKISWICGSPIGVVMMGVGSEIAGHIFSVRHIILSPEKKLTKQDLVNVIREIAHEYRISRSGRRRICIVRHQKKRAGGKGCSEHYHLCLPETDLETGRVLDSRFTRMRDEKLARILELRLRHRVVLGRFNRTIYNWISDECPDLDVTPYRVSLQQAAVAIGMTSEDWLSVRATAAFSSQQHQTYKRVLAAGATATGIEVAVGLLPEIRNLLYVWGKKLDPEMLIQHLDDVGFELRPDRFQGTWQLYEKGQRLGRIDRLSGYPLKVIHEAMERRQINVLTIVSAR